MFTRDDENKLRVLDVRLWGWIWMLAMDVIFLVVYILIFFTGWSILQIEAAIVLWSLIAIPAIRLFYQEARSVGKPLDWDRLPEVLEGMVRAKYITKENAIGIYDCFFSEATELERAWDLRFCFS